MKITVKVEGNRVYTVGKAGEVFGKVVEKRRMSRIVPANPVLRTVFILLRRAFGDSGKTAEWTRKWKCRWMVTVKLGPFETREEALKKEIELLSHIISQNR